MKVKMLFAALAVTLLLATQASAGNCGPCAPAQPCNACDSCCAKPCDLFAGLKNLLKCKPCYTNACAPCDPVVACGPCEAVSPKACAANAACDTGAYDAGCNNVAANVGCDTGCGVGKLRGMFGAGCNAATCDPCGNAGAVAACDPCGNAAAYAQPGACDPGCAQPSPCGACGFNECCCPGPVAQLLTKARCGAKKLFKGIVNVFKCDDCCCGPCVCAPAAACSPCGNAGACAVEAVAPGACNPCAVGAGCR